MSDASVAAALRSTKPLVLVEAPAGCGKTHQAAEYAKDVAKTLAPGRLLIVTHTHAARDVFAERTTGVAASVEIRTTDSLISEIGSAYHAALGLPPDAAAWARRTPDTGFQELASKVATLLEQHRGIAGALAKRYPLIVCDEQQDTNNDQLRVILALHEAGAQLRAFGDSMQAIHRDSGGVDPWAIMLTKAGTADKLDTPHRWKDGAQKLGEWICNAREVLKAGGRIDLRSGVPSNVRILRADNETPRRGGFQLKAAEAKPIRDLANAGNPLLVLSPHSLTVRSLRAFFGRRVPIWEGHTRDALNELVVALKQPSLTPAILAESFLDFMGIVARGFTPNSAYGKVLREEIENGCSKTRRGRPAEVQKMARFLHGSPDHRGMANALKHIHKLATTDERFSNIQIDLHREMWEAMRLADFECPEEGLSELMRRRTHARPMPQTQAISTVHKAKGLERQNVVVLPCDSTHFRDTLKDRCLLYVALSRTSKSLTLVVPNSDPSPLLEI